MQCVKQLNLIFIPLLFLFDRYLTYLIVVKKQAMEANCEDVCKDFAVINISVANVSLRHYDVHKSTNMWFQNLEHLSSQKSSYDFTILE